MSILKWIKYHKRPIIVILVFIISVLIIYNIGYMFGVNATHKKYILSPVEKRAEKLLCKIIQTSFREQRTPRGIVGWYSHYQEIEVLIINNLDVYNKEEYFNSNEIETLRNSRRDPLKRMGVMMDWKTDVKEKINK